jgi:SAM-dependent methyltransferase
MHLQYVNSDAPPPSLMTTILHYEQNAGRLADQYESRAFEEVHASLLDLLPAPGSIILDIGAGSGRDAAWFAARGDDVVAVEPSDAMRTHARALHPSPRIHWLSDSLPELAQVRRLGLTFDFILLSAVWMHLPPAARARVAQAGDAARAERPYRHQPAAGRARCGARDACGLPV